MLEVEKLCPIKNCQFWIIYCGFKKRTPDGAVFHSEGTSRQSSFKDRKAVSTAKVWKECYEGQGAAKNGWVYHLALLVYQKVTTINGVSTNHKWDLTPSERPN